MKKSGKFLQSVAIIVTFVFFYQQIVWAAGDISLPGSVTAEDQSSGSNLPHNLAEVADINTVLSNNDLIINLQDSHSSLSAQYSIVEILKSLLTTHDLDLVAIEGASGYINTAILKSFPDKEITAKTADALMKEGFISAGEFFSITTEKDIALYGVEDNELYKKNVHSFRDIHSKAAENIEFISRLLKVLERKAERVFSPELRKFIYKQDLHNDSKLSFDVYWAFLEGLCDSRDISLEKYSSIRGFVESVRIEKTIDFTKASSERKEIVNSIMALSEREELEAIVFRSVQFKDGKISENEYHQWLLSVAEAKGISVKNHTEFLKYLDYIKQCKNLNVVGLKEELDLIQEKVCNKLLSNTERRELYQLIKFTKHIKRLFEIKLSGREASYLKETINTFMSESIAENLSLNDIGEVFTSKKTFIQDLNNVIGEAREGLGFYEIAQERDQAMLSNTISSMRAEGKHVAALISGGHHTEGLTSLMKKNELSYLVLMPKVHKDVSRPYVAILTKKTGPYRDMVETGDYDLAVKALFHTGDISELEEAVAFLAAECVRKGEDFKSKMNEWVHSYTEDFNNIAPRRLESMEYEPIHPKKLNDYLNTIRVISEPDKTRKILIGRNIYKVTPEGVQLVSEELTKEFQEPSNVLNPHVIAGLKDAVTSGITSSLGAIIIKWGSALVESIGRNLRSPEFLGRRNQEITKDLFELTVTDILKSNGMPTIVSDMDATITESNQKITQENIDAILNILKEGMPFIVLTGNSREKSYDQFLNEMMRAVKAEDRALLDDLILATDNGTQIYRFNKEINDYECVFAANLKDKVRNGQYDRIRDVIYEAMDACGTREMLERVMSWTFTDQEWEEYKKECIDERQVERNSSGYIETIVTQITFMVLKTKATHEEKEKFHAADGKAIRKKYEEYLTEAFQREGLELEAKVSGLSSVDINVKDIDKSFGVEALYRIFGFPKKDMIFFGDAFGPNKNDEPVLRSLKNIVNVGDSIVPEESRYYAEGVNFIQASKSGPKGFREFSELLIETLNRNESLVPRRNVLQMSDEQILAVMRPDNIELKKHVLADWKYAKALAEVFGIEKASREWHLLRVTSLIHDIGGLLGSEFDENIEMKLLELAREENYNIEYIGRNPGEVLKEFLEKEKLLTPERKREVVQNINRRGKIEVEEETIFLTEVDKNYISFLDHASNSIRYLERIGVVVPEEVKFVVLKHMLEPPSDEEFATWPESVKNVFMCFVVSDVFEFGNNHYKRNDHPMGFEEPFKGDRSTLDFIENVKFGGRAYFKKYAEKLRQTVSKGKIGKAVEYSRTSLRQTELWREAFPLVDTRRFRGEIRDDKDKGSHAFRILSWWSLLGLGGGIDWIFIFGGIFVGASYYIVKLFTTGVSPFTLIISLPALLIGLVFTVTSFLRITFIYEAIEKAYPGYSVWKILTHNIGSDSTARRNLKETSRRIHKQIINHEAYKSHILGLMPFAPSSINWFLKDLYELYKWILLNAKSEAKKFFRKIFPKKPNPKILLIASPLHGLKYREADSKAGVFVAPPFGLYRMQAYLDNKKAAEVEVFDPNLYPEEAEEILREKIKSEGYDIVGLTVTHVNMDVEYDWIDRIREIVEENNLKKPLMIAGGQEATHNYEEWLKHSNLDAIILGYGERTLEGLSKKFPLKKELVPGEWIRNLFRRVYNKLSKSSVDDLNSLLGGVKGIAYMDAKKSIKRVAAVPVSQEDYRSITYSNSPSNNIPYQKYWDHNRASFDSENLLTRGATLRTIRLFTSSNCMNACGFCSSWNFLMSAYSSKGIKYKPDILYLSASEVFDLVLQNVREHSPEAIYFNDDDFLIDRKEGRKRAMDFCKMVIEAKNDGEIPVDFKFYLQTKVRNITYREGDKYHADTELLQLMKKAGFDLVALGVENFSDRMLESAAIDKKITSDRAETAIDGLIEAQITPLINIILLPPDITRKDFELNAANILKYARKGAQLSINPVIEFYPGARITLPENRGSYEYDYAYTHSRRTGEVIEYPTIVLPKDEEMRTVARGLKAKADEILRELETRDEWVYKNPPQIIRGLTYLQAVCSLIGDMRGLERVVGQEITKLIKSAKQIQDSGGRLDQMQLDHLTKRAYKLISEPKMTKDKVSNLLVIAGDLKEIRPATYEAVIKHLTKYLERAISREKDIEIDIVKHIARGLLQIDIESDETERLFALLNFNYNEVVVSILNHYHVGDDYVMTFVPEEHCISTSEELAGEFKGKSVMIIEPHHDDAVTYMGNTIEKHVITSAEKVVQVTLFNDPEGVTDSFAEEYAKSRGIPVKGDRESFLEGIKKRIRLEEGRSYAAHLGIEGDYYDLAIPVPVLPGKKVEENGRTLSFSSVFQKPTKRSGKKLYRIIENNPPDVIMLPYPRGSYHQHHRDAARLILRAVIKYNEEVRAPNSLPDVQLFFYAPNIDTNGFLAYDIHPNVVTFFDKEQEEEKITRFRENYPSQLQRLSEYKNLIYKLDQENAHRLRSHYPEEGVLPRGNFAETLLKCTMVPSVQKTKKDQIRRENAINNSVNDLIKAAMEFESDPADNTGNTVRVKNHEIKIHVAEKNILYETKDDIAFLEATLGERSKISDLMAKMKLISINIDAAEIRRDRTESEKALKSLAASFVLDDEKEFLKVIRENKQLFSLEIFSKDVIDVSLYSGIPFVYWTDKTGKALARKRNIIVSGHQPSYYFYMGIYHKIKKSDIFVFEDIFQFKRKDWKNRQKFNGLIGNNKWLTLPIIKDDEETGEGTIKDKRIDNSQRWGMEHWDKLLQGYGAEPYFDNYAPFLARLYGREWAHLGGVNEIITRYLAKKLGIDDTFFIRASLMGDNPYKRAEALAEFAEQAVGRGVIQNPDRKVIYLSGLGAKAYLERPIESEDGEEPVRELDLIKARGVEVEYQDYNMTLAEERFDIDPYASALEVLAQIGPRAKDLMNDLVRGDAGVTVFDVSIHVFQESAVKVIEKVKKLYDKKPEITYEESNRKKYYVKVLEYIYRQIEDKYKSMEEGKPSKRGPPIIIDADEKMGEEKISEIINKNAFFGNYKSRVIIYGEHAKEVEGLVRSRLEENPELNESIEEVVAIYMDEPEYKDCVYDLPDGDEIIELNKKDETGIPELIFKEKGGSAKGAAFIIMAAGSGTRLASIFDLSNEEKIARGLDDLDKNDIPDYSKSTFPITKIRHKSALHLMLEAIYYITEVEGTEVPVVIVCNDQNERVIRNLLSDNDNFGLKKIMIKKDFLGPPVFDKHGKVLRGAKKPIITGGGTGGTLKVLGDGSSEATAFSAAGSSRISYSPFEWLKRNEVTDICFLQCDMPYTPQILRAMASLQKEGPDRVELMALGYEYPLDKEGAGRHSYQLGTILKRRLEGKAGREEFQVVEYRDRNRAIWDLVDNPDVANRTLAYAGAVRIGLDHAIEFVKEDKFKPYIHWDKRERRLDGTVAVVNKIQLSLTDIFPSVEKAAILTVPFDLVAPIKDPEKLAFVRNRMVEREKGLLKGFEFGEISSNAVVEVSYLSNLKRENIGDNVRILDSAKVYFGGWEGRESLIKIGNNVRFEGDVTVIFTGANNVEIKDNVVFGGEGTIVVSNDKDLSDIVIAPKGDVVIAKKNEMVAITSDGIFVTNESGKIRSKLSKGKASQTQAIRRATGTGQIYRGKDKKRDKKKGKDDEDETGMGIQLSSMIPFFAFDQDFLARAGQTDLALSPMTNLIIMAVSTAILLVGELLREKTGSRAFNGWVKGFIAASLVLLSACVFSLVIGIGIGTPAISKLCIVAFIGTLMVLFRSDKNENSSQELNTTIKKDSTAGKSSMRRKTSLRPISLIGIPKGAMSAGLALRLHEINANIEIVEVGDGQDPLEALEARNKYLGAKVVAFADIGAGKTQNEVVDILIDLATKINSDVFDLSYDALSELDDEAIKEIEGYRLDQLQEIVHLILGGKKVIEDRKLREKSFYQLRIEEAHKEAVGGAFIDYRSVRDQISAGKRMSVSAGSAGDLAFIANTLRDLGLNSQQAKKFLQVRVTKGKMNKDNIAKYLELTGLGEWLDKNNVVIVSTEELTLEETIKIAENTFKNLDTRDLLIGDSNNLITSDKDRDIMSDVNSSPMYFQMEGEGIVAQLMVAMVQMTTLKGMVSPSIGKIGVKEGYNNWYVFYPNVEKVDIDLIRREIDNYEENA